MEMWKPVVNFEGIYEVSNLGRVRRVARAKTLDASKIPQAKQMFQQGITLKQVAKFLDTSIATAHSIRSGKTWVGDANYRPVKIGMCNGYATVALCKDGKYRKKSVHRLMWEAFNGPIEGRMEINHIDLDRSNNRLDNFELVTHQQNIKHAIDAYKAKGLLRAVKGTKGFIAGKHSEYQN